MAIFPTHDFYFRYTVAGVFSRCMMTQPNSNAENCCKDPVVFDRINEDIKRWIWQKAPGVRESQGCPKKKIPSMNL